MAAGDRMRARPKSAILAAPVALMNTLEGLRSRCMMGGECSSSACMPRATSSPIFSRSARLRAGRRRAPGGPYSHSASVPPLHRRPRGTRRHTEGVSKLLEAAVGGKRATPRNLPPGHHPPAPTHLSSSQTSQKSVGGAQHAAYSCMTCGWRSSDSASTSRTNVVACSRLRGATRFTATTPPRQVAECTTPAGQCGRHGRVGG